MRHHPLPTTVTPGPRRPRIRVVTPPRASGLVIALAGLLAAGCSSRPPGPPEGVRVSPPWGAIDVDEYHVDPRSELEISLAESMQRELPGLFDPDGDGQREYSILVLSGGGSKGAFGAGFLAGWTAAGTRPDFKVVTGVSTGALISTFAFLGPEYDDELRELFTTISSEDIYEPRGFFGALFGESAFDTEPLAERIEAVVDEPLLAAVAARHAAGYRLYVGSVSMDTGEFVIWDMGAIASSDREDRLERYRKVLLASASVPIVFPPVYFEVEGEDGETYHEMHVDGGAHAQVCFRSFMLEFVGAVVEAGMSLADIRVDVHIVQNGNEGTGWERREVPGSTLGVAAATMTKLFRISSSESLYRTYVLCRRYGLGFALVQIPLDFQPDLDPLDFDREVMGRLFETGYRLAQEESPWLDLPPGLDAREVIPRDAKTLGGGASP